jgi:hypothetical protein
MQPQHPPATAAQASVEKKKSIYGYASNTLWPQPVLVKGRA